MDIDWHMWPGETPESADFVITNSVASGKLDRKKYL